MIYSKKFGFLYIAIPKTGTVSTQNELLKLDRNSENHSITLDDRVIRGNDLRKGVLGHARAKEIKEVVGDSFFNNLNTFTIVRDPFHKLVSAYFYRKRNKIIDNKQKSGSIKLIFNKFKHAFSVILAKSLPFYIWVFIYPYRSNSSYIFDDKGKRLVKYIGRTEYLESDLKAIISHLGLNPSQLSIKKLNTSKHDEPQKYYQKRLFKKLISLKLKKDLFLYRQVTEEMEKLHAINK